ncbi:thymidine phosphorylase [Candidatus Haliotispira prima]|uniref:thymidine phosphorylase n=1 Tax=Candidatus Haliotispira prima TaxID=3034016 RepID=A0ABY8MIE3_9SPIO|nr:thymidine phosphorylase [Candidatus Haliotispira prima]
MLIPQEIICKKRDGGELTEEEIREFVRGIMTRLVTEAQIAAMSMAVFFRGMSRDEVVTLTQAMRDSGSVLSWDLAGPVYDKHSTGGVGDVVSLMLGPILAAAGGYVPMLSGTGLGHTGGTLDKMDSIPGYNIRPDKELFQKVVREVGVAIIGQTGDFAPADKVIYAVRDTSATVESIPLITASILSKKLAVGSDYLVMDVKVGSGAFMPTYERSRELACLIAEVACSAGLRTRALLTDMNRSLAPSAGNALEVRDAIRYLTDGDSRSRDLQQLHLVTKALCAELLALSGLVPSVSQGEARVEELLAGGQAAEKFSRMVRALGGPADLTERPDKYFPAAEIVRPVYADRSDPAQPSFVQTIDIKGLGMAVVALGGGRTRTGDPIDFRVGLSHLAVPGDEVDSEAETAKPLALIHANSEADFCEAARRVRQAYRLGPEKVSQPVAVYEVF